MRYKGILTLFALFSLCYAASATANCAFYLHDHYTMTTMKTLTIPLAVSTISVPAGAEVGSVIYQQRINIKTFPFSIKCTNVGFFSIYNYYNSTPLSETSPGSKIYKTNVSGIGVVFELDADTFPNYYPASGTACTTSVMICSFNEWPKKTFIRFIKTGDVAAGNITASSLPTAMFSAGQLNDTMVDVYKINLSGNLTVTIPTCNITTASQSMTVKMGSYHTSHFSGIGTGTDWKDASIRLNNCGRFYGDSSSSVAEFNGTTNTMLKTINNVADITITPLDGKLKAADGIMSIASGTSAATGVGIQLSRSQGVSGKINLDSAYSYNLPTDGSSAITIPLYARYIQTENTITGGNAIGKLEYTISYH